VRFRLGRRFGITARDPGEDRRDDDRYASREDRDAAVKTGMTDGMEMSYKKLDAMLVEAPA
jgi:hypothetical protein